MRLLRKIGRVCEVLATPGGRSALLAPKPRSIASTLLATQLQSEGVRFRTIIDGGANVGQFARAVATAFPEATIHSFEPSPSTAAVLRENLKSCTRVQIHEFALGSQAGEVEFHCNSNTQTSSILSIKKKSGIHEGIRELQTVKVPVTTLDDFARKTALEEPLLLKLDLQGYELEALKGAAEVLLPRCHSILVESVFEHLYEGEPLIDDILEYLKAQGFVFVRPLAFLKEDTGRVVQMDALFRRR
ncbi:FkbM family methyltransferase [Planctomicrobium sp. SH664]|uniref:FkbM family methyltransferase n=1 Tax=Planctomicrobium sp. SH664 TaxID=3448125 RepID=UPI003F5BF0F1